MKNIVFIFLSFIMMASHINLTIGTHFCGGNAVETQVVLSATALGCGMMEMDTHCNEPGKSNDKNPRYDTSPCCENEYKTVQATDEFVNQSTHLTLNVDYTAIIHYPILIVELYTESTHQFYSDYLPPPIEKDIQLLFQSFLI